MPVAVPAQDEIYRDAAQTYGAALERLARAYEADPDHRLDLLQEIHVGGEVSKGSTVAAPCAPGSIESHTT